MTKHIEWFNQNQSVVHFKQMGLNKKCHGLREKKVNLIDRMHDHACACMNTWLKATLWANAQSQETLSPKSWERQCKQIAQHGASLSE